MTAVNGFFINSQWPNSFEIINNIVGHILRPRSFAVAVDVVVCLFVCLFVGLFAGLLLFVGCGCCWLLLLVAVVWLV